MTTKKSDTDNKTDQTPEAQKSYRTAETRVDTRQLSGHFPAEAVKIFKRIALDRDMAVQELMAVSMNRTFEAEGEPYRVPVVNGRRKRPRPALTPDE